ncbi:MAG: hypothetical protein ACKVVP_06130 [Chloroflexota bacterium]
MFEVIIVPILCLLTLLILSTDRPRRITAVIRPEEPRVYRVPRRQKGGA